MLKIYFYLLYLCFILLEHHPKRISCQDASSNTVLYTALPDLETLLHNEMQISKIVDHYLDEELKRIDVLKSINRKYRMTIKNGFSDTVSPVTSYLLMKELYAGWNNIETMIQNDVITNALMMNLTNHRQSATANFPKDNDIKGAAIALMRLQDVYDLKAQDMVQGTIKGLPRVHTKPLTALDCYELGTVAVSHGDYYHALMWFQESLKLFEKEIPRTMDKVEILEKLATALYQQGNVNRAKEVTEELLNMDPENIQAGQSLEIYNDLLKDPRYRQKPDTVVNVRNPDLAIQKQDTYEALCRGEILQPESERKLLYCFYKKDTPFLRLAPLKAEIMKLDPIFILFRQAITNNESDQIRKSMENELKYANVGGGNNQRKSNVREAHSGWLLEGDELNVALNKRASDMTNLDGFKSERLSIIKYNIGGHYSPHYDFFNYPNTPEEEKVDDDRIATVIFYLATPIAGGATAFPDINLALFPTKNDAVFWHNLFTNGTIDIRTRHGACPIISGTKWIANKWIKERGQEFKRTCSLNRFQTF